jgi:hypothetical protein
MTKRRYTAEEIVTILRQVEVAIANGKATSHACPESGITEQTYSTLTTSSTPWPMQCSREGYLTHPLGQWAGVRRADAAQMALGVRNQAAVHRAWQPVGERLLRIVQQ